jgi:5-methylcytosine-specific restriction endonuclease McrA
MNQREFWALEALSDDELEADLSGLLGAGARVEARIVAHLAEVETRRLHLFAGYSSLYDYCRKRLGLSDYEAFIRIAAARVARKYPVVFVLLERRELHLTAICEVREVLTIENHRDLFEAISRKTKLQIREILAERFPQADVPATLKRLPALEPLSPGRYGLQLTLSAEQKEKLELARDLLSHTNFRGDLAIVVERALDELISRLEKRRFGRVQPRPPRDSAKVPGAHAREEPSATTTTIERRADEQRRRHIANEIRRNVLTRDGARCAFVGRDGQRCNVRAFLQFHHRHAWAHGGTDTADNLEMLCRAHNSLLAERDFGRAHIEAAIAARKLEGPESTLAGPDCGVTRGVRGHSHRGGARDEHDTLSGPNRPVSSTPLT